MISLEEARQFVNERVSRNKAVAVGLDSAIGLYTSIPLTAESDVPAFANTAVDGFAVIASDTLSASASEPVILNVKTTIAAGDFPEFKLEAGWCARIMTGAAIPAGADAIVMVEDTGEVDGGAPTAVAIKRSVARGDNVRTSGSDIRSGELLFDAQTRITPPVIGSLASVGLKRVPVFKRLRVGVISTGSELSDSADLEPGKIRDTNRPSLLATLSDLGVTAIDYGCVPDDQDELTRVFEEATAGCDAVVTSGGVSVGDFDLTKVVLNQLSGSQMRWMQIAIKPAKPFAFGLVGGVPVFCLPGNPVSSLVSFELIVRPALRRMMGDASPDRPLIRAVADNDIPRGADERVHFVRARAHFETDGRCHIDASHNQSSHMLHTLAKANCLAILPVGDGVVAGGEVDVILLDMEL